MDILNTLKKVEKALDLRFEQDGSLYVSKEDTESIKKALYSSRFQNINAFVKKLGNKVVGRVILHNSWLVNFHNDKKELKRIFDIVDKDFLKDIAKDVVDDKVFSTPEFKNFIKQYYLAGVSLRSCYKLYGDSTESIQSRVTCFKRYLKEEYVLENTVPSVLKFVEGGFKDYPEIYNYIQNKDFGFLKSVFNDCPDKELIVEWIISNKISDKKDKVWRSVYLSNKSAALKKSIEYIASDPLWGNRTTKHLIQKMLAKLSAVDGFEDSVVDVYKNNGGIRMLFLHMLEPDRFKNKPLAHAILDRFETIDLPNNSEDHVKKIRDGESGSRDGFKTKDDVIQSISKVGQDFTNLKTLEYYCFKLNKTGVEVVIDAYSEHQRDDNLRLIVSYFLAKFLSKKRMPSVFCGIDSVCYMDEVARFIEELNINTEFSKEFLVNNGKNDLLLKLNRR
ncbi:MAG: hypothetical protein Q9O24_02350 [Gammaproteobacteria bacterium]|nr:hypothetical protein [Gammaproteobacteria bacterium]